MDNFLASQTIDGPTEKDRVFTLTGERGLSKLLGSVPREPKFGYLNLLESSLVLAKLEASRCLTYRFDEHALLFSVKIRLGETSLSRPASILTGLKAPFGDIPELEQLIRSLIWAWGAGAVVSISWKGGRIEFHEGSSLDHEGSLPRKVDSLQISVEGKTSFKESLYLWRPVDANTLWTRRQVLRKNILPQECFAENIPGYFGVRCKTFTLLQTYFASESEPSIKLDFWKGPYQEIQPNYRLLQKKKVKSVLGFRWRPNCGRPAFLHQFINPPDSLDELNCRAVFWVEASDAPATVTLSNGDLFWDRTLIQGPPGLRAKVIWPNLKRDIWGLRWVEDEEYERALEWCREQAQFVAASLSENLEKIIASILTTDTIKRKYVDETVGRIRSLWAL